MRTRPMSPGAAEATRSIFCTVPLKIDAGIAGQKAQVGSVLRRRQGQEQKRQEGGRAYVSVHDIKLPEPGTAPKGTLILGSTPHKVL